jgi:anti-anti-sigma regulatory factor
MGQLKFNIEAKDGGLFVKVEGSINEDLHIEKLSELKAPKLVFDMDKIKNINSCGIREWIRLLESIGANAQIEYINCPQIVVQQMNMVSGFLGKNSKVTSFYAPYFCEDLDEEKQVLLQSSQVKDFKAPPITMNIKGEDYEMEFDAIEDQYFRFLKK